MDPAIELLAIIWMWVLPALGMTAITVVPIFWFLIVPKLARRLTWGRFQNVNVFALADDTGWADIVLTTKSIPEGIYETEKHGWRFNPRLRWTKAEKTAEREFVEQLVTQKYILKDYGKPFWFGYLGKVMNVNPRTLAGLQQSQTNNPTPEMLTLKIRDYVKTTLPQQFSEGLTQLVDELEKKLTEKAKTITILDPKVIKEVLPQMVTPSQLDALATNREQYGMKKVGHEYGKLIIGGALIIGLVIIAIVAMSFLMKG